MTLTHPTVPADQPPPRPAPVAARTYQNQVLGELLHRCAQHDEAALARLYELTIPWIYALVTRLTSSASVADTAMVATYAKVWRQAARHAEHDQSILAWMTTIASEETRRV
jgi:DNA-directed RNA polymerase specialized sigma24 family protein